MRVWRSVLDGLADDLEAEPGTLTPSDAVSDHEWSLQRRQKIRVLARSIRDIIGEWVDIAWTSPEPGFVNQRKVFGVTDEEVVAGATAAVAVTVTGPMLTPPSEPEVDEDLADVPAIALSQSSAAA